MRLWDVPAREPLGEPLDGARAANVESLAFAADGRTFASRGSATETVRLWDVAGRRALGQPLRRTRALSTASPSAPTGARRLRAATTAPCGYGKGILWRDLADLETQVCSLVVRDFTEAEWQELVPGSRTARRAET